MISIANKSEFDLTIASSIDQAINGDKEDENDKRLRHMKEHL